MRGMILLWECCRMLCILWHTGGSRWWRTWWGLPSTSEKSLESAASQSSFTVEWNDGNKLCFIILVSSAWRRCLLPSSSIPHQAGLAYAILDTTVALVTSHRWGPLSPLATSVLTAYKLWLHWVTIYHIVSIPQADFSKLSVQKALGAITVLTRSTSRYVAVCRTERSHSPTRPKQFR